MTDELPRYEPKEHHKDDGVDNLRPGDDTPHELVTASYADVLDGRRFQDRHLAAHTGWLSRTVARLVVGLVDSYNAFRGDAVGQAFDDMPDGARYAFGRERSPVVYVATKNPEDVTTVFEEITIGEPLDEEKIPAGFRPAVDPKPVSGAPDELHATRSRTYPNRTTDTTAPYYVVRAWWD